MDLNVAQPPMTRFHTIIYLASIAVIEPKPSWSFLQGPITLETLGKLKMDYTALTQAREPDQRVHLWGGRSFLAPEPDPTGFTTRSAHFGRGKPPLGPKKKWRRRKRDPVTGILELHPLKQKPVRAQSDEVSLGGHCGFTAMFKPVALCCLLLQY